jgi:hypothetical protein
MTKNLTIPLVILFLLSTSNAQQLSNRVLDSLYYSVLSIRRPNLLTGRIQTYNIDTAHKKSATGLFNAVRINLTLFNKQQRNILQSILDRPATDTSIVSPDGFFRIHYNTTGNDIPTYNAYDFALACDSVYDVEVTNFGYSPPPSDNRAGGDNKFDVYLQNIASSTYSYTEPETQIGADSTYTSFIVINTDFTDFYTHGINAAKVSMAHEFAHAIHIGNYVNRYFSGDEFFYELSATAMENFVFPYIKDYLQYLPAYFDNTQNSFTINETLQEFALGIWNIYQKDRFGFGIIKKEWELMPRMRAMNAINTAIQEYGSSLGTELNTFGVWMYYTNYRTIPGQYFKDASYYPKVKSVSTLIFNSGMSIHLAAQPVSNSFVTIINPSNNDTLVTIIANSDVDKAINNNTSFFNFNLNLYNYPETGTIKITDNYYTKFTADNNTVWTIADILNNSVVKTSQGLNGQTSSPFPSPFKYTTNAFLYIPINPENNSNVQFNVYTISMSLVYSSDQTIDSYNGQTVIKWNGRNSSNGELATGVYIYTIKSGSNIITGKIVIFN